MRHRIVLSLAIVLGWLLFAAIYDVAEGPLEGAAAIHQLNGGDAEYAAARTVSRGLNRGVNTLTVLLLVLIWGTALFVREYRERLREYFSLGSAASLLLIALAGLSMTGCVVGPYQIEVIEEVEASETAFLIKLEGDTKSGQDVFRSAEFLEQSKVAVKRVTIPTRKRSLGRLWYDYEWIPTVRLIKVDRKPVTRKWTAGEGDSSKGNNAIHVESMDSIGFSVGVNITTSITEDMAATFLYNFAGKSLAEVTDQNIQGFIQAVLSREFGSRMLGDGVGSKTEIFEIALRETHDAFEPKGISVDYMGFSEGLVYDDEEIQAAINRAFTTEMDVKAAAQETLAQAQRNERMVAQAIAEREAAQEFAKAQEAAVAKVELEIRRMEAQARLNASQSWNGQLPANIMPQGSSMLFGLDANN